MSPFHSKETEEDAKIVFLIASDSVSALVNNYKLDFPTFGAKKVGKSRPDKSPEELMNFINERLEFYKTEYNRLNAPNSSSMWVYSTFYLAPMEDEPIPSIDTLEILKFTLGLIQMVAAIDKNRDELLMTF